MARIPALEPSFTPDVEARLATMMPAGMPPIGLFRTFAKNLPMTIAMSNWGRYHAICFAARTARVDLEPGAPRFADVTAA
jgi:hypothetical protein